MVENENTRIGRLMLIDDEEVDRFLSERVIKRSGLVDEVVMFDSADRALIYLASKDCPHIDAVILDINMPRMDGFEFLEALSKRNDVSQPGMVVVMLTTSLDPMDKERAAHSPLVKDFFYKPLEKSHLLKIIDHLS